MSMTIRKSDRAHIQAGPFECAIDRYGCIVNPPGISVWSDQNIRDFRLFLKKLLDYRKQERAKGA